jgi:hypothetical protein
MLHLHLTLIAGLIFAVSSIVLLLAGLLTAAPLPAKVMQYTWLHEIMRATSADPWWQDHRFQPVTLIALTIRLLVAFW